MLNIKFKISTIKPSIVIMLTVLGFSSEAQEPLFMCKTEKHNISIRQNDKNLYEYRSWNKPKTISEQPDMSIVAKNAILVDGTQSCKTTTFVFYRGNVKFEVDDNAICVEGNPPKNAVGNLRVFIGGELKSHYWCLN